MNKQDNEKQYRPGFTTESIYKPEVVARIRNSPQVPAAEQRPQAPVFKSDQPPELKIRHR